jgi:hypothetical protein
MLILPSGCSGKCLVGGLQGGDSGWLWLFAAARDRLQVASFAERGAGGGAIRVAPFMFIDSSISA